MEEPSRADVIHFLKCLRETPTKYFSNYKDNTSPDYGSCYSSYYHVTDWLEKYFCVE